MNPLTEAVIAAAREVSDNAESSSLGYVEVPSRIASALEPCARRPR